ncbi:DUF1330 domain-containing protein [Sphingomonas sp. RB1R13]|uniref:DUF1330 domain-containing protein n=1 Tax=Sphingomonas sp. RB1R13 TaxID=3096159 RepID=UPI002FCAA39F
MSDLPAFLILKLPASTDAATVDAWSKAIATARGTVLASGTAEAVKPLEEGGAHEALVLARFAVASDLDQFWNDAPTPPAGLVALAADGLAWEGWPGHDVPTIATVHVPDDGVARAYMLIEGTGHDEQRLDQYRDIILPMLRERGAYYVLFSLGGTTRVLAGKWDEAVLAISRWPSRARAEDFWYSERYQKEAIPLRTGVSRFDVQILDGLAG